VNTIIDLFRDLWNAPECVCGLLGYLLRFVSAFFQSRASMAARLLAAESQLAMCKRRTEQKGSPKPKFTAGFRLLWIVLSKLWAPWQAARAKSWSTAESSQLRPSFLGGVGVRVELDDLSKHVPRLVL